MQQFPFLSIGKSILLSLLGNEFTYYYTSREGSGKDLEAKG